MNARAATREYRLAQWAQIMQERVESGLKVYEFCESRGIGKDAYYYWLRKLRETACERAGKLQKNTQELSIPSFTEVKLSKSPIAQIESGSKHQIEIGSCKINADAGYPVESLAVLIRELVRS